MQLNDRYVNDVEAAKILGVSPQTLRNYRSMGNKGPKYCKRERMVRYSLRSLIEYMEAGRIDPEGRGGVENEGHKHAAR